MAQPKTTTDETKSRSTFPDYDHRSIERKWQAFWDEHETFKVPEDSHESGKEKFYVLDMFPYPSGAGLHVGHPEGYTATDIVSRYKRMLGFNVLHPMGWDAFGLPAEKYAVKTGTHPRTTTEKNIETFRRQLKSLGFSYDWSREVDTTDPGYYKWTQWIFLQLYKQGLAYLAEVPVNWCPALGTVLANEEVVDGKAVEGGYEVVRQPMKQWMFKITAYADRLLEDLEELDWPEGIKKRQRDWIGRSVGAEVDFAVQDHKANIRVFTTRPDTLFGATFMVLAPEHPLVKQVTTKEQKQAVEEYVEAAVRKSELDRAELQKEKTGVFTGGYAINPCTEKPVPIWVADYVLMSYGTGAIMCVPGHDERDWTFAKQYGLDIVEAVEGGNVEEAAYDGDGPHVNSGLIDGLRNDEAKEKITAWLEEKGIGKKAVNYKLRDWLFSRQRYWGEPFPVVYDEAGNPKPLAEEHLPVTLPEVESYKPTGTGESPLAAMDDWVNTTDPETGKPATRETHTMPQWAGSCWYYLRFIDPHNDEAAWDPAKERYWMPVDLYVGGAEHATLHLLYARFWHKVLFDAGLVSTKEPFKKLFNQGLVLGFAYKDKRGVYIHTDDVEFRGETPVHKETGEELNQVVEKMSKTLGNVINPDDVVEELGADSLRLYEMFMGPLEDAAPWDQQGTVGVHRFLRRVWRLLVDQDAPAGEVRLSPRIQQDATLEAATEQQLHRMLQKVSEDIEGMRFNTAIAAMMEYTNHLYKLDTVPRAAAEPFLLALSPFAPHLAEELWQQLGHKQSLAYESWPKHDPAKAQQQTITVAVQVKGKTRGQVEVERDADKDTVLAAAKEMPAVAKQLEGKSIKKEIYVPGKIVNFVTD